MPTTFLKTLSLCLIAACTATLITFSQTSEKKTTSEIAPAIQTRLLTTKDGRSELFQLIEHNPNGIVAIRIKDAKRFVIPLGSLIQSDQDFLATWKPLIKSSKTETPTVDLGEKEKSAPVIKPVPVIKPAPFEIIVPLYKGTKQLGHVTIPAGEAITVIHESNYGMTIEYMASEVWVQKPPGAKSVISSNHKDTSPHKGLNAYQWVTLLQTRDHFAANMLEKIAESDRIRAGKEIRYVPLIQIVDELEIKPIGTPETVSLRPEIEKLGVKIKRQSGPTCTLHSAWHMLEYQSRKGTMPKLTFERFRQINGQDRCGPIIVIHTLNTISQGKALFRSSAFYFGGGVIQTEFVKNELRQGRPVMIGYFHESEPSSHAILVIGFKTEDQTWETTQFEAIDSNENKPTWKTKPSIMDATSIEFR